MMSITESIIANHKDDTDLSNIFNLINKIKNTKANIENAINDRDKCLINYGLKLDTIVNIKKMLNLSVESPSKPLDLDKFESGKKVHDNIIASLKEILIKQEQELEIILSTPIMDQINKEIIETICENPFIKSAECTICYALGIPVDLKIPCHRTNAKTGRPYCEGIVCILCARRILGLSLNIHKHHEVKCPTCRQISTRPTIAVDGYLINIGLLRAIDNYLIYENEIFKKNFGQSLNSIDCSKCNAKFDTLSNLHHHIRGDSGHSKCRESLILCHHCHTPTVRTLCINRICKSCINSFNHSHHIPDHWDDPLPLIPNNPIIDWNEPVINRDDWNDHLPLAAVTPNNYIPPIIDLSEDWDNWDNPVPLASETVWD